MYAGPSKEAMAVFPTRTVSLPDGRTAFSLTMFQAPDMPDELFESQHESLKREFANIAPALQALDRFCTRSSARPRSRR